MRNLLDFIAKYNHWFLFILLEVTSFALLFQYNSYQGSVWLSSANVVAGKVYEWNSSVEQFFSLTHVNKELMLRNFYLERQVNQLRAQMYDITKDTTSVQRNKLQMLSQYHLIPAKVISNSVNRNDNFITLDKGSADGIKSDMGVVCGNGVVGIVYLVSKHYSIVIPALNPKSNISCSIRGRGYFGYLHWSGGPSQQAFVDDIPRHAHFKLGDWIITSGYSSVFPAGVLVGKILQAYNSHDGLSYRLKVQLSTDFGNLRDVCVVDEPDIKERVLLLNAAKDSLKQKSNY